MFKKLKDSILDYFFRQRVIDEVSLPPPIAATKFEEVYVPLEMRHEGVRRSWKPLDGSDFRLLLDDQGRFYVFPKRRLTDANKAGIALIRASVSR